MMNTGKHKLYPNRKLFYGTETPEDMSTYHNPGVHPETAKWLIQSRQIKGTFPIRYRVLTPAFQITATNNGLHAFGLQIMVFMH